MCSYQEAPDHYAQSGQTRFTCKQEQVMHRKNMEILTSNFEYLSRTHSISYGVPS